MMPVVRIVAGAVPSPVAIRVARPMRRVMRKREAARADASPPRDDDDGISRVERLDGSDRGGHDGLARTERLEPGILLGAPAALFFKDRQSLLFSAAALLLENRQLLLFSAAALLGFLIVAFEAALAIGASTSLHGGDDVGRPHPGRARPVGIHSVPRTDAAEDVGVHAVMSEKATRS
jgi:hypothetical protein